jgi:hypothetical protein
MKAFRKFQTALRDNLTEWIKELGEVDILVGIPTFNSEETIENVVSTCASGLKKHLGKMRSAIIVSDGGSLDDTRERAYQAKLPDDVRRMVAIYRGMPGKGTSFRAVFEAAKLLKADCCVVVDSDLKSISPEWVKLLASPVLEKNAGFVTPYYLRHKHDGSITNHIVYPMTRALYGRQIRQPIGGDFGFSGELAAFFAEQDVWQTDVARFGIDIWMTTSALNEGYSVVQANLGTKIHEAKDPSTDLASMSGQVVSTLFYLIGKYEKNWRSINKSQKVEIVGNVNQTPKLESVPVSLDKLKLEFVEGFRHFEPLYQQVLSHQNYSELKGKVENLEKKRELDFPDQLWVKIVYDFAFIYQTWSRNRRRLVDIIAPLYFGKVGAFCHQVADMDSEEAEEVIEKEAQVFEKLKPYLVEKFKSWD